METLTHVCPACGKLWACACEPSVKALHARECGGHDVEIACSERCARQLHALLVFLARLIHGREQVP